MLAEKLGMTVTRLGKEMPAPELILWLAHLDLQAQERKLAEQKRKSRGR